MFQDSATYNRVIKILNALNNIEPFYIDYLCTEIDETEKDIKKVITKLREIEDFPIKEEDEAFNFKSDFLDLLSDSHIDIIATSLASHELNPTFDYKLTIQNILKSLKYGIYALPQREDYKYKEIENFESYELSNCIANEMAIRNYAIANKIKKFHYKNELKAKLSYKKVVDYLEKDQIVDELKNSYWISVYHTEIDFNGNLKSIDYSKNHNYDPFSYNNYAIDSYLNKSSNFNNNQKHKQEVYSVIDYRNLFSDRNPDGFKFSQETTKDGNYYSSITPDFHRKILDPNLISVPLNFSLPKEELIEYISHIKDFLYPDEQKTNNQRQVLTVKELINKDKYNEHKKSKRFPVKIKAKRIADYLYIYDYVVARLLQLKNNVLQEQTKKFDSLLKKYKKRKNEFLYQIDLKSFEEKTTKKYEEIFKALNSEKIVSKNLIKKQYNKTLKLYTIYYMEEVEHVEKTSNIINLFLKDIDIINDERFDLFYKISAIYFYIIEDYKHLKKEVKRINKLPSLKNKEKIQTTFITKEDRKKLYYEYYLTNKKLTYKTLKELKKIRQIVNPKNFKQIKQTELVDIDYNGKEYEYGDENYEERNKWDKDSYEYHKYLEQHAQENIRIQIESILSEKFLFNQLKISDTTILDYYYAIRPYIENLKYKNLLSGIDTPEEIKPLNEKTKDARKLPKEKQQLIRYEAIKLLEAGELSIKGIARKLGVHSSRIYEWRNLYKKRQEKYNNATELIKENKLSEEVIANECQIKLDKVKELKNLYIKNEIIPRINENKLSIEDISKEFKISQEKIIEWKNINIVDQVIDLIKEGRLSVLEISKKIGIQSEKIEEWKIGYLRCEVLKLQKENKYTEENISKKLNIDLMQVKEWIRLFNNQPEINIEERKEDENLSFMKIKTRGRQANDTLLNEEEQKTIIKILTTTNPKNFNQESHLWNIESTKILIKKEFDKDISLSAIRNYLAKWNLLVEQKDFIILNQIVVDFDTKRWIDTTYPAIQTQAKEENAEIWWTNGIFGKIIANNKLRVLAAAKGKKSFFSAFHLEKDESIQDISNFLNFLENILKYSEKKKYIIIYVCPNNYIKTLEEWEKENINTVKLIKIYPL